MDYVLRQVTDEDERFFINSGIKSSFGRKLGFGYNMVENQEDDVKMVFIGGQGIMKEDGTEWSDIAEYCAVLCKEKSYIIEFYSHKKWHDGEFETNKFESIYKIKSIYSLKCTDDEKKMLIEIVKKCFVTHDLSIY